VAGTLFTLQSSQSLETSGQQIAQLEKQLQAQAAQQQVQYVAVLADEKSDASVLVTFDPDKKRLVLQRVGGYQEAADKSLQLWALPPGQAPQSLGVMGGDKVLKLTAAPDQIRNVPTLAISLEPKGGVPSSTGPTGPVLFKGALLQTVL
jgi:anti-sigma-K factor RskA